MREYGVFFDAKLFLHRQKFKLLCSRNCILQNVKLKHFKIYFRGNVSDKVFCVSLKIVCTEITSKM